MLETRRLFGYNTEEEFNLGFDGPKELPMKDLNMLVWLTQVGISVVAPLAAFLFCGLWLREQFGFGTWVVWAGLILGLVCAVTGFRQCLELMERMSRRGKDPDVPPPVSFNEHV